MPIITGDNVNMKNKNMDEQGAPSKMGTQKPKEPLNDGIIKNLTPEEKEKLNAELAEAIKSGNDNEANRLLKELLLDFVASNNKNATLELPGCKVKIEKNPCSKKSN